MNSVVACPLLIFSNNQQKSDCPSDVDNTGIGISNIRNVRKASGTPLSVLLLPGTLSTERAVVGTFCIALLLFPVKGLTS